jgi:adenylate cyclase
MLNDIFSRFDYLVDIYDLNKVKTIGDCYMVTSIPSDELEHDGCARVCRFALDLLKAVQEFNNAGPQHGPISFRVGIATGQVVAGVVGTKRFLFDMWGDAVNVAARMVCGCLLFFHACIDFVPLQCRRLHSYMSVIGTVGTS